MIDPVSIGAVVAGLAASKAAEKAAEKASEKLGEQAAESGWGLGARIVGRVRSWFSDNGKVDQLAALEAAETSGDPASAEAEALATVVEQEVAALPEQAGVASDLSDWCQLALKDPVLSEALASITIDVRTTNISKTNTADVDGSGNVVIQDAGGDVNVGRPD